MYENRQTGRRKHQRRRDRKKTLNADDLVSMNFWAFTPKIFEEIERQFVEFYPANKDNLKSEFYIPKVVDKMIKDQIADVRVLKTTAKWFESLIKKIPLL